MLKGRPFRIYFAKCPHLQWRHNARDGVSNHRRLDCLLNLLFRRRSKKTSELRVTGLCEGNSPVTGEFRTQRDSNAENVSISWRPHEIIWSRRAVQSKILSWSWIVRSVLERVFSLMKAGLLGMCSNDGSAKLWRLVSFRFKIISRWQCTI